MAQPKHMWDRSNRVDERVDARADAPVTDVASPSSYPHEIPRWLHKAGEEPLYVSTEAACDAALADGWQLDRQGHETAPSAPRP